MPKVFIIHGRDSNPDSTWYRWLERELQANTIPVEIPRMPNPILPKIDKWISKIRKLTKDQEHESYLVAHSLGATAAIYYAAQLPEDRKLAGTILVAPSFNVNLENAAEKIHTRMKQFQAQTGIPVIKPVRKIITKAILNNIQYWQEHPLDYEAARKACPNCTLIFSDNDPYSSREEFIELGEKLNCKLIELPGRNHFTQKNGHSHIPELRDEVLNMINYSNYPCCTI